MSAPFPCRSVDKRGSILVLSLWALSVLGIFAISAGFNVRQKIALTERIDRRNHLASIAEMGVTRALIELAREEPGSGFDTLNESWASNPDLFKGVPSGGESDETFSVVYEYDLPEDEGKGTRFGAQDEESKININIVEAPVISKLLQNIAELDEDDADTIAYSMVDWRDVDTFDSHSSFGAEDDYYEDLEQPYAAKDQPFEVLEEALLVRGMTPEIFDQIKDKITIFGLGTVNVNTAGRGVLMALGLSEEAADRIIKYRAGLDREEGNEDDRPFTQAEAITAELSREDSLDGSEAAEISNAVAAGLLKTESAFFKVHSRGELRGSRTALDLDVVIDREGKIWSWSVGSPRPMSEDEIKQSEREEAEEGS